MVPQIIAQRTPFKLFRTSVSFISSSASLHISALYVRWSRRFTLYSEFWYLTMPTRQPVELAHVCHNPFTGHFSAVWARLVCLDFPLISWKSKRAEVIKRRTFSHLMLESFHTAAGGQADSLIIETLIQVDVLHTLTVYMQPAGTNQRVNWTKHTMRRTKSALHSSFYMLFCSQ